MLTAVLIKKKGNNMGAFSSEIPLQIVAVVAESVQPLPLDIVCSHQETQRFTAMEHSWKKTHLKLSHMSHPMAHRSDASLSNCCIN